LNNRIEKPALTREEWQERHPEWGTRPTAEIRSDLARKLLDAGNQHGAAAILLCQPFGFTREDVRQLRERSAGCRESAEDMRERFWTDKARGAEHIAEALDDLANRIEALLPPPPQEQEPPDVR